MKSSILLNLMFKISVEGNCLRETVSIMHLPRKDEEPGQVDFLKVLEVGR